MPSQEAHQTGDGRQHRPVRSRFGALVVIICGLIVIGMGLGLWVLLRVVDVEQPPDAPAVGWEWAEGGV